MSYGQTEIVAIVERHLNKLLAEVKADTAFSRIAKTQLERDILDNYLPDDDELSQIERLEVAIGQALDNANDDMQAGIDLLEAIIELQHIDVMFFHAKSEHAAGREL